jgi:YVTN family beta-propeller protein
MKRNLRTHLTYLFLLCLLCILCTLYTLFLYPHPVYADTFPFVGTLHAGKSPEALAVDTQTHLLYIAHEAPGIIVAFDPISGNVRWRATLGEVATDVQVDSSNHRVFVASTSYSNGQSTLSVLDGATGYLLTSSRINDGDNAIGLDSNLQRIYVTNPNSGVVLAFSLTLNTSDGTLRLNAKPLHVSPHPTALGVNSRMGRLYVADAAADIVSVLDENTDSVLATLPIGEVPLHPIRVDEATGHVFVVCSTSQELDVIDGKTNRVLARPSAAPYPEGVAINTATGRIYVANEGSKENGSGPHESGNTITVIDGQSFVTLGTLIVGQAPDGVEADPALHRIYVADESSNAIVELVDSTAIPLKAATKTTQLLAARRAVTLLQQATFLTLISMFLTLVLATLAALSPRWRARENPRTRPDAVSSRSEKRSLPL